MIFEWLNAREAQRIASDLADQFAPKASAAAVTPNRAPDAKAGAGLQNLLRRADTDPRLVNLNFYKKARFANSFKWRLLEKGSNLGPPTASRILWSCICRERLDAASSASWRPAVRL